MRTFILVALVALCGCSPSPKDIVGDWAKPMGLRNWDGRITGEDFLIRFLPDGTYRVFDGGSAYRDQFTESLYYWSGQTPPTWAGTWHLEGDKLFLAPGGHNSQIPVIVRHFSSSSFEVSCPWRENLRQFIFYRVSITNELAIKTPELTPVGAVSSAERTKP